MNREIKFRVWDSKYKRWCDYDLIAITANGKVLGSSFNIYGNFEGFKEGDNEGLLINQFTGLKDKNGKEIYEGDIVNIQGQNDVVEFYNGGFRVEHFMPKGTKYILSTFDETDVEIIGNIYENPEFLKE